MSALKVMLHALYIVYNVNVLSNIDLVHIRHKIEIFITLVFIKTVSCSCTLPLSLFHMHTIVIGQNMIA